MFESVFGDINLLNMMRNSYTINHRLHYRWYMVLSPQRYIWGVWRQEQVSQPCISNCIPQYSVGCNYLYMPVIPASGTKVIIYRWWVWRQEQVSQACISNCIPQYSVGCNYLCMPEISASGTKVLIYRWCPRAMIQYISSSPNEERVSGGLRIDAW